MRFEGSVSAEIVDSEIRETFNWLKEGSDECKKQAAVLVLQSLAINAPSQFYIHVSDFFRAIWPALTAMHPTTRDCAADSLKAALELTATRKGRLRLQWLDNMWQQSLAVCLPLFQDCNHSLTHLLVDPQEDAIIRADAWSSVGYPRTHCECKGVDDSSGQRSF